MNVTVNNCLQLQSSIRVTLYSNVVAINRPCSNSWARGAWLWEIPASHRHTADGTNQRCADCGPRSAAFLVDRSNKSIKMSGKLAVGVARDSQIFSEHQGASRGHLCDSMASCFYCFLLYSVFSGELSVAAVAWLLCKLTLLIVI